MRKFLYFFIFIILMVYNIKPYTYINNYIVDTNNYQMLTEKKYLGQLSNDQLNQSVEIAQEVDNTTGLEVTNTELMGNVLVVDKLFYDNFFIDSQLAFFSSTDFGQLRNSQTKIPAIVRKGSEYDLGIGSESNITDYIAPHNCYRGERSMATGFGSSLVIDGQQQEDNQCSAISSENDTGERTIRVVGTFDENIEQQLSTLLGGGQFDVIIPFGLRDDSDLDNQNITRAQAGKPVILGGVQELNVIIDGSQISETELETANKNLQTEFSSDQIQIKSLLGTKKAEIDWTLKMNIQSIVISLLTSIIFLSIYFAFLNYDIKSNIQEYLVIQLLGAGVMKRVIFDIFIQVMALIGSASLLLIINDEISLQYILISTSCLILIIAVANIIVFMIHRKNIMINNLKGFDEYA